MMQSRIPDLTDTTILGMQAWFSEMSARDLLFHPDDPPSDIFTIRTQKKTFTESECQKLEAIIGELFSRFGNDVYETALPVFVEKMGIRLDG